MLTAKSLDLSMSRLASGHIFNASVIFAVLLLSNKMQSARIGKGMEKRGNQTFAKMHTHAHTHTHTPTHVWGFASYSLGVRSKAALKCSDHNETVHFK